MKSIRNKIFRITAAAIMLVLLWTSIVYANNIVFEKINQENIAKGVSHKTILRFNENGWLNANVLYVDLDEQDIEMELLKSSRGLTVKETLSSLVSSSNKNVVAAINGDFSYLTNPDSPVGIMVKDGRMISSPVIEQNFAALYIDQWNNAYADYLKYNIFIVSDKGKTIPVTAINKYTHEYQSIMLIDRNWGISSPGFSDKFYDMVEVVVAEDKVVEVRRKAPPVAIPENGYILLASQGQASVLFDNLQVGDVLTKHISTGLNLENIRLAIGGGTLLVKEGQAANFTQNVSGNHPRTAIGITRDRKKLILVTVDGRHNSFTGVDGRALANLMIELGSYEAINMDGGGSTTMLKRALGESDVKTANIPSQGRQRPIINGIGIVSKSLPGSLNGIKAETEKEKGYVGVPVEIHVKAYDQNFNPLPVNYSQVIFTVQSGEGSFNGNSLIPNKAGKTVVKADYMGFTSEVTLNIFEDAPKIGTGNNSIVPDTLNRQYNNKGVQFFVHNGIQFNNGMTLLDRIVSNRISQMINDKYDLAIFTGNTDSKILGNVNKPHISALPGYSMQEYGENLIIRMDNRSKGLRRTNFNQWPWLKNILMNTDKENIFVVLPNPVLGEEGFSDKLEGSLFMDTLSNAVLEGKKVFVLYGGEDMKTAVIDGVRFISAGIYNNSTSINPKESFRYIEFNIAGDEVTYQIKNLFEEQ